MADVITIVSGLPRSGTSMMMQMLEAGGMVALTDRVRQADQDNPKGYYEFERVKKIKEDQRWLPEAQGKVVKMISMLLYDLPDGYSYKVVFMRRHMQEILASQQKMLERRGEGKGADDELMAAHFTKHLNELEAWVGTRSDIDICYVWHHDIINEPVEQAGQIADFLGGALDVQKMGASQIFRSSLHG